MEWLRDNANWIFSGVGIVLFTALGYILKRLFSRESQPGQQQNIDRGSSGFQAGRDIKVDSSIEKKESKR